MKRFNKIILMCIILTVLPAGFIFSCNADQSDTNNAQNNESALNQDIQDNPEDKTAEKVTHDVPDIEFSGYDFRVLARDGYRGMYWVTVDMFAEEVNGEPINDAVFTRNSFLEDKFDINIIEIRQDDVHGFAQRIIRAGSDDFDVLYPTMQQSGSLVQNGLIINLYEVPYLNFDKPWWNKSINASMTIGNRLFGAAGAITTTTNDATWAVLFNKELKKTFEFDDHYQLVREGKWTIDIMHANSKAAARDLNGDGILDSTDQWGAVGQHECAFSLFAASGQKIVEKDSDDMPVLALNTDRTVSVLTKVIEFMTDDSAYMNADSSENLRKYTNVWDQVTVGVFAENRSLYLITNFDMVKSLRNMETNFGILPQPKFNESQAQYYSTMQYNNATVMCIPQTASDLERTGAILEVWGAESVDTLTVAYYDITLVGKYMRDDESTEMLDLIFSTRVIDLGMLFNWSGIQGFFQGFSERGSLDFTSQYERAEPRWVTEMERTVTAIEDNN